MKFFYSICFLLVFCNIKSQTYLAKNAYVRIFSSSPLEDIEATTQQATCAFNLKNSKVFVKIPIKSFQFDKALMQEHFNENYMESDQYPYAELDGIILDMPADITKDGEYKIRIKGKLTLHGVSREREMPATLTIKNGDVTGFCSFKVKCKDHNIDIPRLVVKNIAEEVEITAKSDFKLLKK